MNNIEINERPYHKHCVCWSAVLAGTLVSIGLLFLFCLLTNGVGLTSATTTVDGAEVLLFGVLVWLFMGCYVIFFISGYITGRIARPYCTRSRHGLVYGFMTWSLALIVSVMLITHVADSKNIFMVRSDPVVMVETPQHNPMKNRSNEVMTPATQDTVQAVGIVSLVGFLLFASGALGASLGGCYAIRCCRKEQEHCPVEKR